MRLGARRLKLPRDNGHRVAIGVQELALIALPAEGPRRVGLGSRIEEHRAAARDDDVRAHIVVVVMLRVVAALGRDAQAAGRLARLRAGDQDARVLEPGRASVGECLPHLIAHLDGLGYREAVENRLGNAPAWPHHQFGRVVR